VPKYPTPGIYVQELSNLPPVVVDVASAVPVFVGYTQQVTQLQQGDLTPQPQRISSLLAFEALFGSASPARVNEVQVDVQGNFLSATCALDYPLFQSLRMYFDNGGGACWVVSAGICGAASPAVDSKALVAGVKALAAFDEPTLLVCPEAAMLDDVAMAAVQQAMLHQCGRLQDRFAVLDTRLDDPQGRNFRDQIGLDALGYGASYTPWLKVRASCAAGYAVLRDKLWRGGMPVSLRDFTSDPTVLAQLRAMDQTLDANPAADLAALELVLALNFPVYHSIVGGVLNSGTVACPPSGAVTGVYVAVDRQRGVWKAPANVALNGVIAPVTSFDTTQLDALNVDTTAGKSINAIRAFAGRGVLIWGARTLAGNDNEWRYVATRRLFIMLEESLKKATAWVVFEPNDANTWNKVRGMIENYLTQKWRDGALVGVKPEQAFFVHCGVGQTMTAQDVLEGRLVVEIGMAVVRPAEFIILRFSCSTQRL
jgi:phage tail sheath protein FI